MTQAELDAMTAEFAAMTVDLAKRVRKVYVSESDMLFAMTRWKPAGTLMLPVLAVEGLPDGFVIQSVRHDKEGKRFVFVIQSPSFAPLQGSVTFNKIPDLFDLTRPRTTTGLVKIVHVELEPTGVRRSGIPEFAYTPPVAPPGPRRIMFDKEGE